MQKSYFLMANIEFILGKEGWAGTDQNDGLNVPMWFKIYWN